MAYKLGSLFDGSGGFPLSGALCGIVPTWAAEVEPYPIAVTRSRFPNMKHLGDISKVSGAEIEPVDIITFGSPCQDLSVAGKRAGLKHEANGDEETTRSGLFMEAVRIIKEMREATNGEYPRWALWENVPGAFSSNSGNDFRVVCEELIKIIEPSASMPPVPKNGWAYADSYVGDGWSLAYRVFDAQYWGVPQRRRRIHLIVDFRGECAREVLFEREGLRGYFAEGRTPWQIPASHAQDGTGADDREGESAGGADGGRQLDAVAYTLKVRSGCEVDSNGKAAGKGALVQIDKAATLATVQDQYLFQPVAYSFDSLASNSMKSKNPHSGCRAVEVAKTLDTTDPNPCKNQGGIAIVEPTAILDNIGGQAEYGKVTPINGTLRAGAQGAIAYVVENHPADSRVDIDESGKVQTLTSRMGTGGGNVPMVMEKRVYESHPMDSRVKECDNIAPTVTTKFAKGGVDTPLVAEATPIHDQPVYCLQGNGVDRSGSTAQNGKGVTEDICYTLNTIDRPAVAYGTDVGFFNSLENQSPTLLARQYKDPHLVTYPESEIRYIVRRLTPTECARLQGFADWWSTIDQKNSLTDEEYQFWLEVRNTHAAINGKKVQDYTPAQMLTWYSRLWTDGAEYKMWGNGIALPPALYCMQGIVEVMNREEDDSWLM